MCICLSSLDVHTGIFTVVLTAFTFLFLPVISLPFSSVWLSLDSQSAIYKSEPGLYIV